MHIPLQIVKHLYNFFLEYFMKTIKLEISTSIYLGQVYLVLGEQMPQLVR